MSGITMENTGKIRIVEYDKRIGNGVIKKATCLQELWKGIDGFKIQWKNFELVQWDFVSKEESDNPPNLYIRKEDKE